MGKSGSAAVEFIASTFPRHIPAKEQRKAHSHAAREAHARTRRLRMIEYQASKAIQKVESFPQVAESETITEGCDILALNVHEAKQPVLSLLNYLGSDRKDPFSCFAREFEPIEHFLLDHCQFSLHYFEGTSQSHADLLRITNLIILDVRAVIPHMNINCNKLRNASRYVELMTREWVRLALTNTGSLNGLFLAACRHLLMHRQEQRFVQLSIQYKLFCVQALRKTIHVETPAIISDSTIALGLFLAFDEVRITMR